MITKSTSENAGYIGNRCTTFEKHDTENYRIITITAYTAIYSVKKVKRINFGTGLKKMSQSTFDIQNKMNSLGLNLILEISMVKVKQKTLFIFYLMDYSTSTT